MDCPGCGAFNSVVDDECAECGAALHDVDETHEATAEEPDPTGEAEMATADKPDLTGGEVLGARSDDTGSHAVKAQRLAGWLLLSSVGFVVVESFLAPGISTVLSRWMVVNLFAQGVLGLLLLIGTNRMVRRLASLYAVYMLASVVFGLQLTLILLVAPFAVSQLLLLWGGVSRSRVRLALVLCAASFVQMAYGAYLLSRDILGLYGDIDLLSTTHELVGHRLQYRVVLPGGWWKPLKAGHQAFPDADAAAVNLWTGVIAHTYVMHTDGIVPSLDKYEAQVAARNHTSAEPPDELGPLPSYPHRSRMLRWRSAIGKMHFQRLDVAMVGSAWAMELVTNGQATARVESTERDITRSLRIAPAALRAPEGMTPVAKAQIDDPDLPYTLKLVGGGWYAERKRAMAGKKVDAHTRTWTRPYRGMVVRAKAYTGLSVAISAEEFAKRTLGGVKFRKYSTRTLRLEEPRRRDAAWWEVDSGSGESAARLYLVFIAKPGGMLMGEVEAPIAAEKALVRDGRATLETLDWK